MRLQRFHFIPKPVQPSPTAYAAHVDYMPD
jgi:hypothetical protein